MLVELISEVIDLILKGVFYRGEKVNLKLGETDEILDATGFHAHKCFVDSHLHLLGIGIKLLTHDLEKEDLGKLLKSAEGPLIARGWTEMPSLSLINSVEYPVALVRKCGHKAVINDVARELLELQENVLYEGDVDKVYELLSVDDYKRALKMAEGELFKVGISYVHSDDLHAMSYSELVSILKEARIRVYEKLFTYEPKKDMFGKVSNRVYFGAIKLYADGSVGARTAFMKKPYRDTGDNGVFILNDEVLRKIFLFGKKNGVEVTVHVIGDGAIEKLSPYFSEFPGNRIIHAQFVPREVLPFLKSTRFSVQPHFYFEDREILKFVDTDSMRYPFLYLYKNGFEVLFSSDAPVSPHDPRYVAESAMKMGFSKEEVLEIYTKGSEDLCLYENPDPLESYPVAIVMKEGEVIEVG